MTLPIAIQDLPVIEVKRLMTGKEADDYVGVFPPEVEPNVTEAGIYVDADTSEPFLAYFPMDTELTKPLRAALLSIKMSAVRRGGLGIDSISRTFGMAPRLPLRRQEACRATSMAADFPEEHAVVADLAGIFSQYLQQMSAEIYEHDKGVLTQVEDEWKIGERDLWTSGVINQDATLPFHRDNFNFQTWSAMPVMRRQMGGGYLTFPEYGLTVACRDGWVLFFPGYKYVHGVTPLHPKAEDGYRYSVVYYALRGMKDCFTHAVETAKALEKRTKREQDKALAIRGEIPFQVKGRKPDAT